MARVETSTGFPIKENGSTDAFDFGVATKESKLLTFFRPWGVNYSIKPYQDSDVKLTDPSELDTAGRFRIDITRVQKTKGRKTNNPPEPESFTEKEIERVIETVRETARYSPPKDPIHQILGRLEGTHRFATTTLDLPAEPLG